MICSWMAVYQGQLYYYLLLLFICIKQNSENSTVSVKGNPNAVFSQILKLLLTNIDQKYILSLITDTMK